jgi:lysophospholipase L1-like esterase
MLLQTHIDIPKAQYEIRPQHRLLFIGSCFADNIGQRFKDDAFQTMVNPYGVMYNPASVMHSVRRAISDGLIGEGGADVALFTLGTNHVYILKETGEIVDNCQKRPQRLFEERELTISECADYLRQAIAALRALNKDTKVIITVSPIRYAKYGFHESQLSKATLLLAANELCAEEGVDYFPAYEIMNDELRDYRFYQPDMLHPSAQAVDYIHTRFKDTYFGKEANAFVEEWQPIRRALNHKPFDAESDEYKAFIEKARREEREFRKKWGTFISS